MRWIIFSSVTVMLVLAASIQLPPPIDPPPATQAPVTITPPAIVSTAQAAVEPEPERAVTPSPQKTAARTPVALVTPTPKPQTTTKPVATVKKVGSGIPVRLSIPSIKLDTRIISLGLDSQGRMDVPDGKTKDVGWFNGGPVPGAVGSAVLDAHVYAAFKNLHNAKVGDDIYVENESGALLHFTITKTATYALDTVPAHTIFNRTGGNYLNLITCAGVWDAKRDTYSHRLIVYAKLVH